MKPFLCPHTFNKRYELICVSTYIERPLWTCLWILSLLPCSEIESQSSSKILFMCHWNFLPQNYELFHVISEELLILISNYYNNLPFQYRVFLLSGSTSHCHGTKHLRSHESITKNSTKHIICLDLINRCINAIINTTWWQFFLQPLYLWVIEID